MHLIKRSSECFTWISVEYSVLGGIFRLKGERSNKRMEKTAERGNLISDTVYSLSKMSADSMHSEWMIMECTKW
jgi:hypothetical protein